MTRQLYGFRPSDYTTDAGGAPLGGVSLTVWDQRTGGTQVTDLLTVAGAAITTVTSASDGRVTFQGPTNFTGALWVDAGGSARYLLEPTTLADYQANLAPIATSGLVTDIVGTPAEFLWNATAGQYRMKGITSDAANAAELVNTARRKVFHGTSTSPHPKTITSPVVPVFDDFDEFRRDI
jgi:hypothetical protein